MDDSTRRALQSLSRGFYAANAQDFDAKRSRPWRGWARALQALPSHRPLRVLDLGCGNGRLLGYLESSGHSPIEYFGVDECVPLLDAARSHYPGARFESADLFDQDGQPRVPDGSYDLIALMGVLHHIPSERARIALVQAALTRVAPQGLLVLTVWRFASDPRLSKRIVDWSSTESLAHALLDRAQLEDGDALVRWGDGQGHSHGALRYCHAASSAEIDRWLQGTPATRFFADGASGELNEYVVVRCPQE